MEGNEIVERSRESKKIIEMREIIQVAFIFLLSFLSFTFIHAIATLKDKVGWSPIPLPSPSPPPNRSRFPLARPLSFPVHYCELVCSCFLRHCFTFICNKWRNKRKKAYFKRDILISFHFKRVLFCYFVFVVLSIFCLISVINVYRHFLLYVCVFVHRHRHLFCFVVCVRMMEQIWIDTVGGPLMERWRFCFCVDWKKRREFSSHGRSPRDTCFRLQNSNNNNKSQQNSPVSSSR